MARIIGIATDLPQNVHRQSDVTEMLATRLAASKADRAVLERVHTAARVQQRHFALPIEQYEDLNSFSESNAMFAKHALALAENATRRALAVAGVLASDVDHVFFTTVTGVGAPSLDVLLGAKLGFRSDIRRTPSFGLGCAAGAAGIARVADYLAGHPNHVALVVSVELCSLTLQWQDRSMANFVGTGIFGDGAATLVMVGEAHPLADGGIKVLASRSILYPSSQEMIGWKIGSSGFTLMLEAGVPDLISSQFSEDVSSFLAAEGIEQNDIDVWIAHPGGPKILEAFAGSLSLNEGALASSWGVLAKAGNMSSAAVLHVLFDEQQQTIGSKGLLFAMGPGVSCELVLLEWM